MYVWFYVMTALLFHAKLLYVHSLFLPCMYFYPAALKGSGVLSYPERAGGRAGGRQGRQAPLTLSRP